MFSSTLDGQSGFKSKKTESIKKAPTHQKSRADSPSLPPPPMNTKHSPSPTPQNIKINQGLELAPEPNLLAANEVLGGAW